jgi:cysteinyl-tRNA synthetase
MAMRYLGETFDIHGGGMDLKFPHHENEIAQAESDSGKPFARYWLHNGLTRFNTKKISKSDPEFDNVMASLTLSNLLKSHPAERLRFLILRSQYRSPIDFSDEALAASRTALDTFYRLFERVQRACGSDPFSVGDSIEAVRHLSPAPIGKALVNDVMNQQVRFLEAMDDDFNTAGAIGVLFEIAGLINRFLDGTRLETNQNDELQILTRSACGSLMKLAHLLGLFVERPAAPGTDGDGDAGLLMALLIEVRQLAREAKQFQIADRVRDRLTELGFVLEDRQDGTGWRRA